MTQNTCIDNDMQRHCRIRSGPGPGCSKRTTTLVTRSYIFQCTVHQNIATLAGKRCEEVLTAKLFTFFSAEKLSHWSLCVLADLGIPNCQHGYTKDPYIGLFCGCDSFSWVDFKASSVTTNMENGYLYGCH